MRRSILVILVLLSACGGRAEPSNDPSSVEGSADDTASSSSAGTSMATSCVETYSPETLAGRSFAFDGTITGIEMRTDANAPAEEGAMPWVTFEVHEWYAGGSGPAVSVWLGSGGDTLPMYEPGAPIEAGTRLLVAGEPRWGGEPLDDPIAWTCGFTQLWSAQAAAEWEAATA